MIKSKIKKIKSLTLSKINFSSIQEGDYFENATFREWPTVGKRFSFYDPSRGNVTTTEVIEILEDRKFKTKNSIYELITIEEERDDKINLIIE